MNQDKEGEEMATSNALRRVDLERESNCDPAVKQEKKTSEKDKRFEKHRHEDSQVYPDNEAPPRYSCRSPGALAILGATFWALGFIISTTVVSPNTPLLGALLPIILTGFGAVLFIFALSMYARQESENLKQT